MTKKPSNSKLRTIAHLNDEFRTSFVGGDIYLTQSVNFLGPTLVQKALEAVRKFDAFTSDNDPYGEHDLGSLEVQGHKFFWKIDYYDLKGEFGSNDPSNLQVTTRVMTIMLVEEY